MDSSGPDGNRGTNTAQRFIAAVQRSGQALASALSVLNNRERRIFEARRFTEEPITLKELADYASACARST